MPSPLSVNGKEPIAVWCPSLSVSDVGTVVLSDLVGSNHGVLTNMDAVADWVADTGAGGIRALDFDGSNDRVETANNTLGNGLSQLSFSIWIKRTGTLAQFACFLSKGIAGDNRFGINCGGTGLGGTNNILITHGNGANNFGYTSTNPLSGTDWVNAVYVFDGSLSGNSNRLKLFVNGSQATLTYSGTIASTVSTNTSPLRLAADVGAVNIAVCRLDDARIFNVALDASDVAYLYYSGNGRGRIYEEPIASGSNFHPLASLAHPLGI